MITKDDFQLCESATEEDLKTGTFKDGYSYKEADWKAQVKFDGERIMCAVIDKDVILINRRGKPCNFHFEDVVENVKALELPDCIIDGEIISRDDDFSKLQRRALTKSAAKIAVLREEIPVKYMVFDVLQIGGVAITNKPLRERLVLLKELFAGREIVLEKGFVELAETGSVNDMLEKAHKEDREGVIIKHLDGIYEGKRSRNWRKVKFFLEGLLMVTKYEENPKGLTVEDNDGNRVAVLGAQHKAVKDAIDKNGQVEIQIQYLEKTAEGRLRFPSFRGLKE